MFGYVILRLFNFLLGCVKNKGVIRWNKNKKQMD